MIKKLVFTFIITLSFSNFVAAETKITEECKRLIEKYKNYRGNCNKDSSKSGGLSFNLGLGDKKLKLPDFLGKPAEKSKIGEAITDSIKKKQR